MKTAELYKYGLHFGEESIVEGNEKAGMLYFSGCHLKCSFCYVPEMSQTKKHLLPDNNALLQALKTLEEKGAKNLNLISVTHFWPSVIQTMEEHATTLPWVIKLSGYEPLSFVAALSKKLHTIINFDFKVWNSESAKRVGLPINYGIKAVEAIEYLQKNMNFTWTEDQKLSQGVLVRHLWMPGFEEESYAILLFLREKKFQGPINLMTHFVSHGLKKAPLNFIENCKQIAKDGLPIFLVDGERV